MEPKWAAATTSWALIGVWMIERRLRMLKLSDPTISRLTIILFITQNGSTYDPVSLRALRHLLMLLESKVDEMSTSTILTESVVSWAASFRDSSTYSSISYLGRCTIPNKTVIFVCLLKQHLLDLFPGVLGLINARDLLELVVEVPVHVLEHVGLRSGERRVSGVRGRRTQLICDMHDTVLIRAHEVYTLHQYVWVPIVSLGLLSL